MKEQTLFAKFLGENKIAAGKEKQMKYTIEWQKDGEWKRSSNGWTEIERPTYLSDVFTELNQVEHRVVELG